MDHWWEGKMLLVDALMPLVSTLALNFEAPVYAMLDGAQCLHYLASCKFQCAENIFRMSWCTKTIISNVSCSLCADNVVIISVARNHFVDFGGRSSAKWTSPCKM